MVELAGVEPASAAPFTSLHTTITPTSTDGGTATNNLSKSYYYTQASSIVLSLAAATSLAGYLRV